MKKSLLYTFFVILILLPALISAQEEITVIELKDHVEFLASDSLKGRKPGTPEGIVAAQYIRDEMQVKGVLFLSDAGFQYFDVVKTVSLGENNEMTVDNSRIKINDSYMPLSYSENGLLEAPIVFCGYGFSIDSDTLKWNDYRETDVEGKWVLVLRGDPEPENSRSLYIPHSSDRSKVLTAKDHGAAGVMLVSGVEWEEKDNLPSLYYDKVSGNAGIHVVHIKRDVADMILTGTGKSLEGLEKQLLKENKAISFETGSTATVNTEIIFEKVKARNVIALIEGNDPVLKNEYIVIGAHYDHLGMGGPGSGSRTPDTVAVHNGADDNASGVAGIIEIAERLAAHRENMRRSVIAMAFDAEEMGLLGSKYFIDHPPVDKEKITAMLNIDMMGRLNEGKVLMVGGSGTSRESEMIIKSVGEDYPLDLRLSPEGYGPSDHAPFYANDIPVFFINTGVHSDYHTPADDPEALNYEGQKLVADFTYDLIMELANRDASLTYQEAGSKSRERRRYQFKVTLGIMPDFTATEVKGLGVGGVRKDGPADGGGMEKGDIITAIDGKSVNDIYEYMNRLKKLEPGQTITVDVLRDGEKKVLIVQL